MYWTSKSAPAGPLTGTFLRCYLRLNMASGGGSGWQTPCSPPVVDNTGRHTRTSSCAAAMSRDNEGGVGGGGGWSLEYTQDLHLKMSKKIAQLTKVCV